MTAFLDSVPATETTIPVLPCVDPETTRDFYSALGFESTYYQTKPYLYLAFSWRGLELHFGAPAANMVIDNEDSGGCLILVDEVAPYHAAFKAALKQHLGRVPTSGRPRLTRLRPGATRFTLVDPSGNNIIVIRRDEPDIEYGGAAHLKGMAKALDNARILHDFKNDDVAAFRALTSALRRPKETDTDLERAQALAFLIELAPTAGAGDRVDDLVGDLRALGLPAEALDTVVDAVADPAALRALLDR